MDDVLTFIISRGNYFIYIILMMLGMYGIFMKKNYMKKIIGLNILQTAIILFFISTSAKRGATIPIIEHHNDHGTHTAIEAVNYINPLPHVLMLTAIVVAVATLGVSLAMTIKIYTDFKTIEEDQILSQIMKGETINNNDSN
ncbi:MAG: cation:proton antiporter subunit C [Desulfobacterales bacterium]|nr:cation:proton antiporter subunit C [Deltaproteobacteria bacterium]NNL42264.1 cation:proton antiporter subunit C [Desulfobacterales bacterium]